MSETFRIEIPLDSEGFADLQCPHCGERFRLRPEDYSTDEVPKVFCPSCGLPQDIHYSDEIMAYARSVAKAKAERLLARSLGALGKVRMHPQHIGEPPRPTDATLEKVALACCGRHAKLNPLTVISEPYCPYCGDRPMNNIELKRTTREFHLRASQLAEINWQSYDSELGTFLSYVKGVPCLMDFIRSCGPCSRDWNEVLNKNPNQWQSEGSDFSADPKTRTAELFSFLEFLVDNNVRIAVFSIRYDIGGNCPTTIRAFHKAVPGQLIAELELHLQSLADETETVPVPAPTNSFSIGNVGQMNVANDNSTIHATMVAGSPQIDDLVKRLDQFLETAKRDLPAAQEDVESSVDEAKKAILEGTTWSKVKKWFLAIKGSVCESVALVEAFGKIMQFAQSVLPL